MYKKLPSKIFDIFISSPQSRIRDVFASSFRIDIKALDQNKFIKLGSTYPTPTEEIKYG
jgi:hypothetical protein